jgi:putative MATE family efflux protein
MNEKTAQTNILGTEKIGKLLIKFAVPGIISMVVNSLYNIIDQIFIGNKVGYLGNGATTVIFPLTVFAMAFALLIGDGAASFMSLKLGEGDEKQAAKGMASGVIGIIVSGLIIGILYIIFLPFMCRIFGATDQILPYAEDYGFVISIGIPFCCICCGFASIIRADGNPKFNMIGLLTGCVLNIIFDTLFIFVFEWGVTGAALATIIGQIVNAIMNIVYISKFTKTVHINKEAFKGWLKTMPRVMRLGVSSFITQLAVVVAMATRNNVLTTYGAESKYGSDIPVTTLGITMKVFSILMSIVMGLSAGAQPIFGYNYGSKQYDRVKKTFKYTVSIATGVMIVAFLIAQLKPMSVIGIFGSDSDLYNEFAVKCMRYYLMLIPVAGLPMVSGVFFQSMGYPVQSSLISLSKQIIFQLPATLILPIFMGVEGALWAGPVSDVMALAMTIFLLLFYWKKIFNESANKTIA